MTVKLWGALNGTSWTALDGTPWVGAALAPGEFTDAAIIVEIAWGADITAAQSSWSWTDVTADVLHTPGITSTVGKLQENQFATPASMTLTLKNISNDYSQYNPLSSNWPNVHEGVPIRHRLFISGTYYTCFQGRVIGFAPGWDVTGNYAVTTVTAAGIKRTIGQRKNNGNLHSCAYRFLSTSPNLAAYWSLEGGAKYATMYDSTHNWPTSVADAGTIPGESPLPQYGTVDMGRGSDKVANVAGDWTLSMNLLSPPAATGALTYQYSFNGGNVIRNAGKTVNGTVRLSRDVAAKHILFWTEINDAGTLDMQMAEADNSEAITAQTAVINNVAIPNFYDAKPHTVLTTVKANGLTGIDYAAYFDDVLIGSGTYTASFGSPLGAPAVHIGMFSDAVGVANVGFGHAALHTDASLSHSVYAYITGKTGETADARLRRICAEEGINYSTLGFYESTYTMGPQAIDTLMNILQECELVAPGTLLDGLGDGLSLVGNSQRYDQASQFTINGPIGEVQPDFKPLPDDFNRVNQSKIDRKDGLSFTYEDTDGPLGTGTVGTYAASPPGAINYADDGPLENRARWEVHKGTVVGYRYPNLTLNMRKIPSRAAAVAGLTPGFAFTLIPPYQAQMGTEPIVLIAEGWTQTIAQDRWEITFYCSPQDAYNVWKISDSQLGRFGTTSGAHTLASAATAGATTLSLATATGHQLWTTAVGDFPMTLLIDGIKLIVTAITSATSPQTATLSVSTPVPRTIQAGASVSIWKNGVIKL